MRSILAVLLCATAVFAADAPRRAPGFALTDSNREIHDLYDYRGKPVILEFMQTTCPHCASFVSVLQKIQEKYGSRLQILAVVVPPDNTTTVGSFIKGHGISYPVLFDTGQATYSYVRSAKVEFPQVFIIDPNGMIYSHYEYSLLNRDIFDGNGLMNEIDRIMAGPKSTKK